MENNVKKRRELFFWVQMGVLSLLMIVTTITFLSYNSLHIEKGIKVLFAPFLSLVPLLFILTIIRDWIKKFNDADFSKKEIIKYSLISLGTCIAFAGITKVISLVTATEILVAIIIAVMSSISFISIKVRDIFGMSILTGIAEGIIVYMVFFF